MAYVCKSGKKLAFCSKEAWNNKVLNISTLCGVLLQIVVLVFEPLRNLLKLSPCSVQDILIIFGIAIIGTLVNAVLTLCKNSIQTNKQPR
jgi:hypothetical protein